MLIVLIGASGTGKSSIEAEICRLTDYKKIISWTTRKPRPGEENDVDYHFTTKEAFLKAINEFAEYEEYSQNRFYGTMKLQYANEKPQVTVLTPHGVRQIKRKLPDLDMFVVYITSPLKDRVIRYINRCGESLNYSDMTELGARIERDWAMFRGFEEEADLCIENDGSMTINELALSILAELDKYERKNA